MVRLLSPVRFNDVKIPHERFRPYTAREGRKHMKYLLSCDFITKILVKLPKIFWGKNIKENQILHNTVLILKPV